MFLLLYSRTHLDAIAGLATGWEAATRCIILDIICAAIAVHCLSISLLSQQCNSRHCCCCVAREAEVGATGVLRLHGH